MQRMPVIKHRTQTQKRRVTQVYGEWVRKSLRGIDSHRVPQVQQKGGPKLEVLRLNDQEEHEGDVGSLP